MITNANTMPSKRGARDTRAAARSSLKPHYWLAVLACLIAALLGTALASGSPSSFDFSLDDTGSEDGSSLEYASWEEFKQETQNIIVNTPWKLVAATVGFALLLAIALSWVGYCVRLGLCRFHLSLTDREVPAIGMLFQYFGQAFWRSVGMNVLRQLILFLCQIPALLTLGMGFFVLGQSLLGLWNAPEITQEALRQLYNALGQFGALVFISLLLLLLTLPISLRYVMANYVMAENPEVGARGALVESSRMMKGNKWRYFCLQFSFIGWDLLAALVGIGGIFLAPYVEQSITEFYHEVSGRAAIREAVEELAEISEGL